MIKRFTQSEHVIPGVLVFAYALRSFLAAYAPQSNFDERLWLEWLGRAIMRTGTVPHALGPETLSAAGAHWTAGEWLFAYTLAWCAARHLDYLMDIVMALFAVTPMLVVGARLRAERTHPVALGLALIIMSVALGTEFQVRASVVASAVAALLFAAMHTGDRRRWAAPVLIAFLANIHATALLLSAIPAVYCVGAWYDERRIDGSAMLIAVLSFLATLCTPFGLDLWRFAFTLSTGGVHHYIAEWTPLYLALGSSPGSMLAMIAGVLTALAWLGAWHKKVPSVEIAVLVLTGALAIYAERFAVLYIIAIVPTAFRGSASPQERMQRSTEARRTIAAIALLISILEVAQIVRMIARNPVAVDPERPGLRIPLAWTAPTRIGTPSQERVFCSNFTFCNAYLVAGARVYIDGPFRCLSACALERDLGTLPGSSRIGGERLSALDVNVVVASAGHRFALALRRDPEWHLVETDDDNDTFVKRDVTLGRQSGLIRPRRSIGERCLVLSFHCSP